MFDTLCFFVEKKKKSVYYAHKNTKKSNLSHFICKGH